MTAQIIEQEIERLTPEQIENPDSLKASERKKLTTLTNALENIDRGLAL